MCAASKGALSGMKEQTQKIYEVVVSIFMIGASVFMLHNANEASKTAWTTTTNELSTWWFPRLILITMIIMSLGVLFFAMRWLYRHRESGQRAGLWDMLHKKSVITFFLMVGYALLWRFAGFSLGTFVYFAAQTKVLDPARSLKQILLVSLAFTALLVVVFSTLFRVSFNEPLVELAGKLF